MSDFKDVVKRLVLDTSFRNDMLRDVEGTLKAHNYKVLGDELSELQQLNQEHFDELDERFSNRLYSLGGTSLTSFTKFTNTVDILGTSGMFGFTSPRLGTGGLASSGTW